MGFHWCAGPDLTPEAGLCRSLSDEVPFSFLRTWAYDDFGPHGCCLSQKHAPAGVAEKEHHGCFG